jgi:ABC-type branched-subunit amino acid transport system substrate-binding protein
MRREELANPSPARVFVGVLCAAAVLLSSAQAAGDLVIGNVASTTNPTSKENSSNLILGYSLYFDEVNRRGGVHGRKVRLVNRDDGVVAERMVAAAQELIRDPQVIALAGFLNTAGLVEISKRKLLADNGIAMIAPIGPFNGPNFYPMRPGYTEEAEKLLLEARETHKKRIAMVYYQQAFGPSVFAHAQEAAKKIGINIVATASFETAPERMLPGIRNAADMLAKAEPDAVIVIAAGAGAFNFVKEFRQTPSGTAQLYALSPADSFGFVKVAGLEAARGVVISQAIPYPGHRGLAVVREYNRLMKQHAADKALSFYSLEGFMGAKIVAEALRRAGPNPTRAKVIAALDTMKDYDLGDFLVSYTPAARAGSKVVDLTIIGRDGSLYR